MKDDFELIVKRFDGGQKGLNVYPLGDLHIGSEMFDVKAWEKWVNMVCLDKDSAVVVVGDVFDNGLRNSKSLCYGQTMRPREQKEWAVKNFGEFADKIIGAVQGNHEYRSTKETDDCPLYDVMCKYDLEDLYRENMAFMKIGIGRKSLDRQFAYTMCLSHGASRGKVENFGYVIDGMDIMVSGHTHNGSCDFPAKLVIDPYNECVRQVGFVKVVVPSLLKFGGYAMRDMYKPTDNMKFPVIKLSGEKEKEVGVEWI